MPRHVDSSVVWLRDVDGTGSMHPCAEGDPGAIEYTPSFEPAEWQMERSQLLDRIAVKELEILTLRGKMVSTPPTEQEADALEIARKQVALYRRFKEQTGKHPFPGAYDMVALDAALTRATTPQPVTQETPTNRKILAFCHHASDPYVEDEKTGRLTLYAAHCEDMGHVEDGWHVLEHGGGFDDRTYDEPTAGWMPDWWTLAGSDGEVFANPIMWLDINLEELKA